MTSPRTRSKGISQAGFTLTEILVVLALIAILIGLTTLMISSAVSVTDDVVAQAEAAQLPHQKRQARAAGIGAQARAQANGRYLVVLNNGVNPQAAIARIGKTIPLQVTHVYTSGITGFAARVPPGSVAALQNMPGVSSVEQDRVAYAQAQTVPTGVRRIGGLGDSAMIGSHAIPLAPENLGTFVPGRDTTQIIVAVLDSGVDSTHPDLNVTFAKAFGAFNTLDTFGHGTHVAGTIGALNNTIGVVGVCPGCRIWNLKVLDATGAGTSADVLAGIDFVAANAKKIRVANISFGFNPPVLAVNNACTTCVRLGVVVVASVGNSAVGGTPVDAINNGPGGSTAGVIGVGALADSDGRPGGKGPKCSTGDLDDTMAAFSNFGATVDFLAPGVDILSTVPVAMKSYAKMSGTSMAGAHVSGLCALRLSPLGPNPLVENVVVPVNPFVAATLTPAQMSSLLSQNSPNTALSAKAYRILGALDKLVHPVIYAPPF